MSTSLRRSLMTIGAVCVVTVSSVLPTEATAQGAEAGAWQVSDAATVRIGSVDGPAHFRFNAIVSAVFSGPTIVVADRGSSEVRMFDQDGAHLRTVGGAGYGPGEFTALVTAAPYLSDSLYAFDFQSSRVTVFGSGGELGRTFILRAPPSVEGRAQPVGWLANGSWVTTINSARPSDGEVTRSTLELWHFDADGTAQDRIGVFPGRESARSSEGDMAMDMILPWGMKTYIDHRGGTTVVGDGGSGRITVRQGDGSVDFGMSGRREVFDDDAFQAYVEATAARIDRPDGRRMLEQMFRSLVLPEVLPWFDRVLVDSEGLVWIRRFTVPGSGGESWEVFDGAGNAVATVRPPEGFEISDVGSNVVIGVTKDELDVEYIEVRSLIRN